MRPQHPRMLCAKYGWNWLSGSWEEILNSVNVFSLFHLWTNLNLLYLRMQCQVWLKFAQWFLKKIFKSSHCISTISQLSLLWEKVGPLFDQIWIPFTQGCIVPILVEMLQWFWKRRWKCDEFAIMTLTTDNFPPSALVS